MTCIANLGGRILTRRNGCSISSRIFSFKNLFLVGRKLAMQEKDGVKLTFITLKYLESDYQKDFLLKYISTTPKNLHDIFFKVLLLKMGQQH